MAELLLIRSGAALVPADDDSRERICRMPRGQAVRAEVRRTRHLPHHKKFMALVGFVAEHHPVYDNKDKALVALRMTEKRNPCAVTQGPLTTSPQGANNG